MPAGSPEPHAPPAAGPSGPGERAPHRPLRGIPTSRAYWELKAEQMMNRIFDPDSVLDLPVEEPAAERPPAALASRGNSVAARPRGAGSAPPRRELPVALLSLLGGVCMVSAVSTVLYITSWNQVQQTLRQERNLLLVERLRSLGPAVPAPAPAPAPVALPAPLALQGEAGSGPARAGEELPPPPDEPWIEQLSQLPGSEPSAAPILRVPLSPRLAAAAPAASRSAAPAPATPAPSARLRAAAPPPAPVLVGVVAAAGKAGSAIFQVGAATTSVSVGEAIGTSGWRLRTAAGDSAEIERDGEVRRVSISSGT
ncbi:MAG: hypothetical protein VKJ05_04905 [Synechococcaceae cyanobacterium]|nr:hypothetical protein [Synechococcaceae cyanobacterium]